MINYNIYIIYIFNANMFKIAVLQRPKTKIWMKEFLASIFNIQPWTIDDISSLMHTLGSLLLVFFMLQSLIFLALMVMIRLGGYTWQNKILVCITLLMSTKSHLHPFIWNMKTFNGYVGTSRLMKIQTGQIFANSFCNDLALVHWWIHRSTH